MVSRVGSVRPTPRPAKRRVGGVWGGDGVRCVQCPSRTSAHHGCGPRGAYFSQPRRRSPRRLSAMPGAPAAQRGIETLLTHKSGLASSSSAARPSGCQAACRRHHHALCRHLPSSGEKGGDMPPAWGLSYLFWAGGGFGGRRRHHRATSGAVGEEAEPAWAER